MLIDVKEGPLEKCRQNLEALDLDRNAYSIRLGDGFEPVKPFEVSTAIMAGMGGDLIQKIIKNAPHGLNWLKRAVLQPRSRSDELRVFLASAGFMITDYALAWERGRICEIYSAENYWNVPDRDPKSLAFRDTGLVSQTLLEKNDPLICNFIDSKIFHAECIINSLKNSSDPDSAVRLSEWTEKLETYSDIRRNL